VTEQSSEERALDESDRRYRVLVDSLPGAVYTFRIDAAGRRSMPFVSDRIDQLIDLSAADVMADVATVFQRIRPDAVAAVEEAIRRSWDDLSPWIQEVPITLTTGEERWIGGQSQPIRETDGSTLWHGVFLDITERKRAEFALRESQQRYERVVRHIGDALLVQDVAGRVRYANQRFRDLFGIDEETSLRAVMPDDYVGPEWRERLRDQHDRRVRGEAVPVRFEFEAVRPDGRRMWLEATVVTVEEEGHIVGTQAAIHDLTDRKRMEDALQLLSTGVTSTPGSSVSTELARQIATLLDVEIAFIARLLPDSSSRIRMLAWTIDGRPAAPKDYDLADTPGEAVVRGKSCVFEQGVQDLYPSDRLLVELDVSSYAAVPLFDQGRPCGVIAVMSRHRLHQADRVEAILHLFSVRMAAELERQRQDARFHDLFEFSPDATIMVDLQGRITMANARTEAVFGYSREELQALTVEQLMTSDVHDEHRTHRRRFLAAKVPRQMGASRNDLRARRRDGTVFPVEIGLSPIESDGQPQVVAVIRDISERVRAEQERQALEGILRHGMKMEALGNLAGGVAHDFNNLLAIINGHAELVLRAMPAPHASRGSLDEILRAGARGVVLTDEILAFSRHHARETRIVDLNAVLADMNTMLRQLVRPGVTLAVVPGQDIGFVEADPEQLAQVIMNLATNASDAMPNGGVLTIETASAMVDTVGAAETAALAKGRYVVLRVSDTGIGMDAATREKVFDPFFTTKPKGKGTGLGLSIAYGIAQQSGGSISVRSEVGHGATFSIFLPQTDASASEPKAAGTPGLARGTETIVVVDDEAAITQLAGEMLAMAGHTILTANSGEDALRLVARHEQPVHLLLTDVMMPGMGGPELAVRLGTIRPGIKVVYMSGFTEDASVLGTARGEPSRFIGKPFTAAALTRKVRDVLDGAS
jgi:hypothetical protein